VIRQPAPAGGRRPATAIVPVKRLAAAKSRLAGHLDADERAALVVGMLRSVLGALAAVGAVTDRLVVSPDPVALAVARAADATPLRQAGDGLNGALEAARAAAPAGATLLIVPADLPLLRPEEIVDLLALTERAPVVIAPDREGRGTNVLALAPAARLPFRFGPDSFRRHRAEAAAAGLATLVYRAPGTALDLDTPADLAELRRLGWPPFGGQWPEPALAGSAG
jgi:2-phospho-L-lactate guanylyltransferase